MKKQFSALLLSAAILGVFTTACAYRELLENNESSPADSASNDSGESSSSSSSSSQSALELKNDEESSGIDAPEEIRYVYGEIEIPDIPGKFHPSIFDIQENKEFDGRGGLTLEESARTLGSMAFETKTVGDYKLTLVGEKVRTDKENFPGRIFVNRLFVEVEKDGVVLGRADHHLLFEGMDELGLKIFEDKIGNYFSLYEMDIPILVFRYFYDDKPARAHFNPIIGEGEYIGILLGSFLELGYEGVGDFTESGIYTDHLGPLAENVSDELICIPEENTLVDAQAGVKYVFNIDNIKGEKPLGFVAEKID